MEKKTIRSGAPFVFAGVGVLAVALTAGIGTISSYLIAAGVGCAAFVLGKRKYPDRVVEVETAPKSGNAEVDALIREWRRGQLDQLPPPTTRLPIRRFPDRLRISRRPAARFCSGLRNSRICSPSAHVPALLPSRDAQAAQRPRRAGSGGQRGPQPADRRSHRQSCRRGAVRLPQAAGRAQRVPLHQSGKRNGRAGGHAQIRRPDRRTGRARRCKRGTAGGRPLRLALRQGGKEING